MEFKKFLSSYSGIRTENFYYRVICGVLLASNLLLGVAVLSRKETVVLVPPTLKEQVKVSVRKADQKYQESWALFFALLLGNVTPRNIEFVASEIEKYLAPAIYQSVMKDVVEQADGIKETNISASFEPRELVYDDKTGHVLVKGQMVMRGAFGKPQNVSKTFEFGMEVKNYYPQINYLDAYERKDKNPKEESDAKKTKEPEAKKPGN